MTDVEWTDIIERFHRLGMWYALNHLKPIATVREPYQAAEDVMQEVWLSLWKENQFDKGRFVGRIFSRSLDYIRRQRPVDVRPGSARRPSNRLPPREPGDRRRGRRGPRPITTSMFPTQIFGVALHEVTMANELVSPACGDE